MFTTRFKTKFHKNDYIEYQGPMSNPGRGFYSMYRIDVTQDYWFPGFDDSLLGAGSLVLLEFILTGYNKCEMDEAGLKRIRESFEYFTGKGKQIIVRYVYDVEGKGLENEPTSYSLIENHMRSVGPVTAEFSKDIMCVQGLFVGSWGEMHTSKFLTEYYVKKLVKLWNQVTEEKMVLSLRRPDFIRMCVGPEREARQDYGNLGFYNDGMYGSDDDLGTYGYITSMDVVWPGLRQRGEEIKFLNPITDRKPFGGELLADKFFFDQKFILEEMKKLHLCYVNRDYDPVMMNRLSQLLAPKGYGVEGHRSLLDYIGDHLGYRFIVRDCVLSKSGRELVLSLENAGFSRLHGDGSLALVYKNEELQGVSVMAPIKLSEIAPGTVEKISFPLPENYASEYSVGMEMYYNSVYPIKPANNGSAVAFELGRIYGK